MRLHAAVRTSLACAIVGCTALYGPKQLSDKIKFLSFAYLTAVLIVSDAMLGNTVMGCWHAFCATMQVVPLAMLVRWAVAPHSISIGVAAVVVGVCSFMVGLPKCTHLTAKRIAFGQIVLVCTDAVLSEDTSIGVMHPAYVAASTALGAIASVLALLIPYPALATTQVAKVCNVYTENGCERMNLYLEALTSKNSRAKQELISRATTLAETGTKLLQSIKILQEGTKWERPPWRKHLNNTQRWERIELCLRGMEYSLASAPDFPDQLVLDIMNQVRLNIEHNLDHNNTCPESSYKTLMLLPTLDIKKHGWMFFYFSCIDMLLNNDDTTTISTPTKQGFNMFGTIKNCVCTKRIEFAFKCSLSLAVAVLFGLIFDRKNGCWAGLSLAISFVTGKQAIFTLANTRLQGTAIGSIYGVICCFLFHYEGLRLLALLPWIIFTSILRYSKMYGQSGGFSAAIGALFILGRKNYGAPNEFALARVCEVFIGLSVFIAVKLSLQPMRAAGHAKNHLHTTLRSLLDFIKEMRTCQAEANQIVPKLRNKHRNLTSLISKLRKLIADAEMEPDLWYLPFRSSTYQKLAVSLSNVSDLLYFAIPNFKILTELSGRSSICKEFQQQMNGELELFQGSLNSSIKYLENANSIKKGSDELTDIEIGSKPNPESQCISIIEQAMVDIAAEDDEEHDNLKERTFQCLATTCYCIRALVKEMYDIEILVRENYQWEGNPIK